MTTNFRVGVLGRLPSFPRFLAALLPAGTWLLESSVAEVRRHDGDANSAEGLHWRNDAVDQVLQCSDAMAYDR